MKAFGFLMILTIASGALISCKKQCTPQPAVYANAGKDLIIRLHQDSATLSGSVTSTVNTSVTYSWSKLSGPGNPPITNATLPTAKVNALSAGAYTFRLQVASTDGTLLGNDTVSINVLSALTGTTTVFSDGTKEAHIDDYNINNVGLNPQLDIGSWTIGGSNVDYRELIKFDLSSVPATSLISSATLYLYSIPSNPLGGNTVDAQYGVANSFYIRRITSSFTDLVSWAGQPTNTAVNEVIVPQSTSSFEDQVVDVTALVQDIQANGNNGFEFQLVTEGVHYNIRQFASSLYSNAALHPKLVINYY